MQVPWEVSEAWAELVDIELNIFFCDKPISFLVHPSSMYLYLIGLDGHSSQILSDMITYSLCTNMRNEVV